MASPQAMWLDEMCSARNGHQGMGEEMRGRAQHMATMLELNPSQIATLKGIEDARMKGASEFRASICAQKPDLASFTGRLNFRVAMMQHRLDAFKDEAGRLSSFYNSLDAKQKAAFEEMGMDEDMRHEGMNGPRTNKPSRSEFWPRRRSRRGICLMTADHCSPARRDPEAKCRDAIIIG